MTPIHSPARVAGSLLALCCMVACGSDSEEKQVDPPSPIAPQILGFEANPGTILSGEAATLSWSTKNAASIAIADDAGHPVQVTGQDVAQGSVSVSPTETTAYTLTASGEEGAPGPAYRTITVKVTANTQTDAPTIESFTASAASVSIGGEVTLSWSTSHALALTLKDDAGEEISLGSTSLASGSVGVKPTRSPTIYTLVASGDGGRRATAEARVEVDGLPRVHSFSVDPIHPVLPNATVKLIWETSHAKSVVIADDRGNVVVGNASASGTHSLPIDRTTTFRLTATSNGNEATAVALAQVGAEIDEFDASPRVARVGDSIALRWKTTGAESVVITGPGDFRHEPTGTAMADGTFEDALAARGDYTLHARMGDVVRTSAIFVEATEAPRIRSFSSSHSILTAAADHPGEVVLSYVQDGGTTCTLFSNGVAVPGKTKFRCLANETFTIELTGATDLRLVAENEAGSHQLSRHVDAVGPARIVFFTKTPSRRLNPGDFVDLAWKVSDNAVGVWMKQDDADVGIGQTEFTGTLRPQVFSDTLFTLFAENSLGDITKRELPVLAGPPEITKFEISPRVAAPHDTITFSWTCDGGDELTLTGEGGAVMPTVTDHARIDEGTFEIADAPAPGTFPYTLTVRNETATSAVKTLELLVTDGPLVRSLTASKSEIPFGTTVDISWVVSNDASDRQPTLVLKDNYDVTYDLTASPNYHPNSGRATIEPLHEGRHEFTLIATTDGTRASKDDVEPAVVEVTVEATILSFTADQTSVSTEDGTPTVRLDWETENAVELWVYEATAAGTAILPAIHQLSLADGASPSELAAGNIDVQLDATTRYLLRVANRVGTTHQEMVTVLVDLPRIDEFKADEADLIIGESTTLRWKTTNGVTATVQPMTVAVTALEADPTRFVDISTLPGAQALKDIVGSTASQTITFPAGFRFPFSGQFFSSVRVSPHGYLSFDLSSSSVLNSSQSFPTNEAARGVHLAVWWGNLTGTNNKVVGQPYWRFDEIERTITIMWKKWSFAVGTTADFDMNFEVVLHENGSFEYRYGEFSTTNSSYADYLRGSRTSIGFQDLDGASASTILKTGMEEMLPEAVNHLAWFFEVDTPLDGDLELTPSSSRTYMLSVANADAVASADTLVNVWKVPEITLGTVFPSSPQIDAPFTVSWETVNASEIRLVDEEGKTRCKETNAAKVAKSTCKLTVDSLGSYQWEFQAINGIERNLVTRPLTFEVSPRFAIDKFEVSTSFAIKGQPITVTWEGFGGYEAELYECVPHTNRSNCKDITFAIAGQDPNNGSYQTTANSSTEYYFRLLDSGYAAAVASEHVWVDVPIIDVFNAPTKVIAGSKTTLSWSTTNGVSVDMAAYDFTAAPAPQETYDEFIDISATGTEITATGIGTTAPSATAGNYILYFADLPEPFTFPYVGTKMTELIAKTDGVISFDAAYTNTVATNADLVSTTSYPKVHLAPFWDDLTTTSTTNGATGKFHWELRTQNGVKFLILQWTAFQFNSNYGNLNFQVLLWENGDIDFRYGEMSAQSTVPNLPKGQSATIGVQANNATWIRKLSHNTTLADGLGGRSWRFSAGVPTSGQTVVTPTKATTYRLCLNNNSLYDEVCEERTIAVIDPGSLMISEIMIAPNRAEGEWFEIRNISTGPIDLAGFEVTSGSDSYMIPDVPAVIIQPNAFAVLARSGSDSDNGGVASAVVYGDAIELDDTAGSVALVLENTVMDEVTWTTDWTIEQNKSFQLEPWVFDKYNTAATRWCASSKEYGNGDFHGSPGELGTGCLTGGAHDFYLLDPNSDMPWIDISRTETVAAASTWSASPYRVSSIPLGFWFPYFEDQVDEMTIFKMGAIGLGPQPSLTLYPATGNVQLPSADGSSPKGLVAPLWDTIYPNSSSSQALRYEVRYVGGLFVMVVEWSDVGVYSQNSTNLSTFQAQLWESGDIVFAYQEPKIGTTSYPSTSYGSCATIGIQNLDRDRAYEIVSYWATNVSCHTSSNRPAYGGRSYHFIPKR